MATTGGSPIGVGRGRLVLGSGSISALTGGGGGVGLGGTGGAAETMGCGWMGAACDAACGDVAWGGAAVPVAGGRSVSILRLEPSTTEPYACLGRATTTGMEGVRAGGGSGDSPPCQDCFGNAGEPPGGAPA